MDAQQLNTILEEFRNNPLMAGIKRRTIRLESIDNAMQAIEGIGKMRNPKFTIDENNLWTYKQLVKWVYADPTMEAIDPDTNKAVPGRLNAGLYICGPTGTGKSWAMEILCLFTEIDNLMVDIGGEPIRLWWAGKRAEEIWEESCLMDEALNGYKNRKILCIQDLASEPASEAVRMGARREPLRQILEARGDRTDRLTLITSNFGICDPEIEKRYTGRVVSRLREMCNFLVMPGTDRRLI